MDDLGVPPHFRKPPYYSRTLYHIFSIYQCISNIGFFAPRFGNLIAVLRTVYASRNMIWRWRSKAFEALDPSWRNRRISPSSGPAATSRACHWWKPWRKSLAWWRKPVIYMLHGISRSIPTCILVMISQTRLAYHVWGWANSMFITSKVWSAPKQNDRNVSEYFSARLYLILVFQFVLSNRHEKAFLQFVFRFDQVTHLLLAISMLSSDMAGCKTHNLCLTCFSI